MADALIAVRLCAIDRQLGGMILRGGDDARKAIAEAFQTALPPEVPCLRLPIHIDDERLLGGLDLAATLAADRPVTRRGLLADADEGLVIVPLAERVEPGIASRMAAVLDTGEIVVERDGMGRRDRARPLFLLFDEGVDDESIPEVLAERLAFRFDLSDSMLANVAEATVAEATVADRHDVSICPEISREHLHALAQAATALGVASTRGTLLALRAARAAAALDGRLCVHDDDVVLAIRLVLIPRATVLPVEDADEAVPPEQGSREEQGAGEIARPLDDVILDAVRATLPPGIIAAIAENGRRAATSKGRGSGAKLKARLRGRPVGSRAGSPRGGNRLSLIDTLRAAAPWQRLRREDGDRRIRIGRDDLRIKRFKSRAETTTIFVVDASGSSAAARLAEAKGAVELLLAQAYVKRAQVALIAFRGTTAELLLPPTRSLTRARRALAELPGGGGTPLAAGLAAAREVVIAVRAKDRTPFVVVLTDGRGNIALDGSADAFAARCDAEAAAKALAGTSGVLIDISARPRTEGRMIAEAMGERFIALPRGDAIAVRDAVAAA